VKHEVTRRDLQRAIVVNAATKPVTILITATVAVCGLLLGATWLLPLAVVAYLALAALTFFDGAEAERVGDRMYGRARAGREGARRLKPSDLAPPIREQVERARREARTVGQTIDGSALSFSEVGTEVDALVAAIEAIAGRAQRVWAYLAEQDVPALDRRLAQLTAAPGSAPPSTLQALRDQRTALEELRMVLTRSLSQMEEVNAQLGGVNARVVRMAVAEEEAGEHDLAVDVRALREQVEATAAGLQAAYGDQGG
jgi:hypothetical protein